MVYNSVKKQEIENWKHFCKGITLWHWRWCEGSEEKLTALGTIENEYLIWKQLHSYMSNVWNMSNIEKYSKNAYVVHGSCLWGSTEY